MATRTTITLEDDIDGSPAEETVRFGLGAAEYEIDLSAANASLCVPIIPSTSCHQAIFVDHAADASVSSDAVNVKVDWLG
jgi:hypothetical protein